MAEPTKRKFYQTHSDDEPGMTDSEARLKRLMLPNDLTGKRVLDIGCNEGFFCNECIKRGAAKVVGLDGHQPFLDVAVSKYAHPNAEFILGRWNNLPDGEFDLVIWTSAMHYEKDPASVFQEILKRLAPDGLFILECGYFSYPSKEMVLSVRSDHSLWYPTWPMLETMLSDFSYRRVGKAEVIPGDPVPRGVIHCRHRLPIVLLIHGKSHQGKTFLASQLSPSATRIIQTDGILARIANGKHHHTELEIFIRDNHVSGIYEEIDKAELTEKYVELLATNVTKQDKFVVIEGFMTELQIEKLNKRLEGRAMVWGATRV